MPNTKVMTISELSDIELDSVAAGRGRQVAVDNVAIQFARNAQANLSLFSDGANQGGNQSNNNNAGNVS